MSNDTIAAISTGLSESGIGIVRVIGNDSLHIISKIYKGKKDLREVESHTIHFGHILDNQDIVDEVLVSVMRGPKTYAGEDTIEINCHGGVFVVKKVLEIVLKSGARLAEPGEITKRAFLNGKMDLSQAEAVIDVIKSKNDLALKNSLNQLKGSLKNKIELLRKEILFHTALIESALDDPEHSSLVNYDEHLSSSVSEMIKIIEDILKNFQDGFIIKEGIQTVIIGKPNVGKSSLLNALAKKERAIVTDIAGTTRDVLEESINLGGLTLNLVDTAGIRETEDLIEKIGVEKAKEYLDRAQLVIYVIDGTKPLDHEDSKILELLWGKRLIIIINKSDLQPIISQENVLSYLQSYPQYSMVGLGGQEEYEQIPIIDVSAKEEQGLPEFIDTLHKMFIHGKIEDDDEIVISNLRHKKAIESALYSLNQVLSSIDAKMPEDFFSIDLVDAYESLGKITGESLGEDLVNEIFSKFCLGK